MTITNTCEKFGSAPPGVGVGVGSPSVAEVVGSTIASLEGVEDAFGVIGSGNLVAANALASRGVRFHHARREDGCDDG